MAYLKTNSYWINSVGSTSKTKKKAKAIVKESNYYVKHLRNTSTHSPPNFYIQFLKEFKHEKKKKEKHET